MEISGKDKEIIIPLCIKLHNDKQIPKTM